MAAKEHQPCDLGAANVRSTPYRVLQTLTIELGVHCKTLRFKLWRVRGR